MLKNCIPILSMLKKTPKEAFPIHLPFLEEVGIKNPFKKEEKEIPQQKTGFNAKFFAVLP